MCKKSNMIETSRKCLPKFRLGQEKGKALINSPHHSYRTLHATSDIEYFGTWEQFNQTSTHSCSVHISLSTTWSVNVDQHFLRSLPTNSVSSLQLPPFLLSSWLPDTMLQHGNGWIHSKNLAWRVSLKRDMRLRWVGLAGLVAKWVVGNRASLVWSWQDSELIIHTSYRPRQFFPSNSFRMSTKLVPKLPWRWFSQTNNHGYPILWKLVWLPV